MPTPDHNALIAAAATSALRPLGCVRKGRSRTWLDDQGWWVGVVEFQPSSWARGTYLNVGACWLWSDKGFLSFDDGNRVEPFHAFEAPAQFEQVARHVAQRARDEVQALRERFATLERTAAWLRDKEAPRDDIWQHFHAGVAAGLMGWTDEARRHLERAVASDRRDIDWVCRLRERCGQWHALAQDTPEFRSTVAGAVLRERAALKLAPLLRSDLGF